jgi:LPS export ABC transporter protein LptC
MKKLLFIILMFPFLSCTVFFKNPENKNKDFPDLVLGDFKYESADDAGVKEWELRASEAKIYDQKKEIYLYNMAMTFFNADGSMKSFLAANGGYVDQEKLNIYAEGKVKILSDNQSTLEANKVYWNNDKKLFYTDPEELVTLKRGNSVVRGYNLQADSGLKQVTLYNGKGNIKK